MFPVALTNIGSEDIVDANAKLILGLIWSIILRFTIADITMEGLTAKEGLLLWVQKRTTPYVEDFYVKDFTYSWMDGLPFCGLIHRHRPDLLDYWSLDKSNKLENTRLAFDIAERELGIPKLFNAEDVVNVKKVRLHPLDTPFYRALFPLLLFDYSLSHSLTIPSLIL